VSDADGDSYERSDGLADAETALGAETLDADDVGAVSADTLPERRSDPPDDPSSETDETHQIYERIAAIRATYTAALDRGNTPEEAMVALVAQFDTAPGFLRSDLGLPLGSMNVSSRAEVRAAYAQLQPAGKTTHEIVARLAVQIDTDPAVIRIYLKGVI